MVICKHCGIEFEAPRKDREAKFCSVPCYLDWKSKDSITKKCEVCNKEFNIPFSRQKTARVCSDECRFELGKRKTVPLEVRKKISDNSPIKGSNNPFWRGGVSKKNKNFRKQFMNSVEYRYWRDCVFRRDKYQCQICGDKKGGNLHANHIKTFIDYPKIRLKADNGITLCDICHIQLVTHHELEWESYFNFYLEVRSM